METITKDGDIVTITRNEVKTINLGPLKEELSILEGMKVPSDKEVLTLGRQGLIHPYYEQYRQDRIAEINDELSKWQSL